MYLGLWISTDAINFFKNLLLDKTLQKDVASERRDARSAINTTQAFRRSVVDEGTHTLQASRRDAIYYTVVRCRISEICLYVTHVTFQLEVVVRCRISEICT